MFNYLIIYCIFKKKYNLSHESAPSRRLETIFFPPEAQSPQAQSHLQWRLLKNTSLEKNESTFPSVPEDRLGQKENMWHRCMSTKEWVNLKSVWGTLLYWRWHCAVVHWLCLVAMPPGSESSHYDRNTFYNQYTGFITNQIVLFPYPPLLDSQ